MLEAETVTAGPGAAAAGGDDPDEDDWVELVEFVEVVVVLVVVVVVVGVLMNDEAGAARALTSDIEAPPICWVTVMSWLAWMTTPVASVTAEGKPAFAAATKFCTTTGGASGRVMTRSRPWMAICALGVRTADRSTF
jgi:hypothetical protein